MPVDFISKNTLFQVNTSGKVKILKIDLYSWNRWRIIQRWKSGTDTHESILRRDFKAKEYENK